MRYNVGDRVRVKVFSRDYGEVLATIKRVGAYSEYSIETDKDTGGHDCGGRCKQGHGWYCGDDWLEPHITDPFQLEVRDYIRRALL